MKRWLVVLLALLLAATPVWALTIDCDDDSNDLMDVNCGGSNAGTFTDGGILLGSGTGAFTALGVATNGQLPIGDGTTDPVLANITETGDALVITNGAGTIDFAVNAGLESLADLAEADVSIAEMTGDNAYAKVTSAGANTFLKSKSDNSALEFAVPTLASFTGQTAWRVFYSNTDGDITELALGADGTYLRSNGPTSAPTFDAPAGSGDVTGVGDCASGACLDGSSDGGTYVRLYDGNSHYSQVAAGDSIANLTFTLPTAYPAASGYALIMSDAGVISTSNLAAVYAALAGATFTGAVTLDDGSGASPNFTFTDETNETAVFSKADSGFLSVTTAAADGFQVLTGNLKVGNGSPGQAQDGEDAYVEGKLEVDGAIYADGGIVAVASNDPYVGFDETDGTDWWFGVDDTGNSIEWRNSVTVGTSVMMELNETGDLAVTDDLSLLSDAAVLNFGADSDVKVTHVADTGLLLGTPAAFQLQFRDSAVYIASVNDGYLDLEADTGIRFNGPVTLANEGSITAGGIILGDSTPDAEGEIGYASNQLSVHDGTASRSLLQVASTTITKSEMLPIRYAEDDDAVTAPAATAEIGTTTMVARAFDKDADEGVVFWWHVPLDYSAGLKYRVYYALAANGQADETAAFSMAGCSVANSEAIACTEGDEVVVTDELGTDEDTAELIVTGWSAAITVTGVAAGEMAKLRLIRDVSGDDYTNDLLVAFIEIKYQAKVNASGDY